MHATKDNYKLFWINQASKRFSFTWKLKKNTQIDSIESQRNGVEQSNEKSLHDATTDFIEIATTMHGKDQGEMQNMKSRTHRGSHTLISVRI